MAIPVLSHPTVHFWQGDQPVAFVFSVPGTHEKGTGHPVAGTTGENLSMALAHLSGAMPNLFPSKDRYAYRITNAYNNPIAQALGHSSSEATDAQVLASLNIARVVKELAGCHTVILCGLKAQLLHTSVAERERMVVCASHTSNQALASKFNTSAVRQLTSSRARREARVELWAQKLLENLSESGAV